MAEINSLLFGKEELLTWLNNYLDDDFLFQLSYLEEGSNSQVRQLSLIESDIINEENIKDGVSDRSEE